MIIEIKPKYSIGTVLYYIKNNKIRSTTVDSFKIIYTEGKYYNDHLEITYHLDMCGSMLEGNIEREFYLDKKEIIQNFVSQL